ncbi:MAG: TonB-dependent receptor [Muribaculum sp.]|nr:TonB-dependent receptor [Muribaculum sp.]
MSADTLETVVVTATRTPKLLKDTPVLTRVLTQNDINLSGQTDISGLLQQKLPGVEFSLGMAQNPQINFTGFGGGGILFLVDGERIAGETLDNPDYSRLNLNNADRIEIVKGAASTLYGSNATGGVVNIISAKPKEGTHLALTGWQGSHRMQRYGALATFSNGKFANSLDAVYDSQAEIKLPHSGNINKIYATHSWSIREKAVYTFNSEASVAVRGSYYRRQRESSFDNYDRYSDISAGISGRWRDLSLRYSIDSYDKYDFSPSSKTEIRDYRNRQNTIHAQYSHEFDHIGTITAGGDWLDDYLMSYEFGGASHSQTNLDAYLQWDWQPIERLWLVPGVRYDWFSASKSSSVSPKMSVLWRERNLSVRLNYAAGFRAPNLKELYMNFDMAGIFMIYGNPNLKSETSHNLSLSGEWTKGSQSITASVFHNFVDNRISYLWDDSLNGAQYINQKKMNIFGVNVSASKSFDFGMTLHGEYIYTYEKYHKDDLRANPTRPHALTAQADYSHSWNKDWRFTATANFKWMSAVTGDLLSMFSPEKAGTQRYPAYSLLNVMVRQELGKYVSVDFGIDNLLNYIPKYYYYNSLMTTGIGFRVGVGVRI